MDLEEYPPQEPLSEAGQAYSAECWRRSAGIAFREEAYGPDPYQRLALYEPKKADGRVLVFWHGGGWTSGTAVGLQFALLLSGAVLTETTFTWPGIGLTLYEFLQSRDYTGVQGVVTFYACFVVAVSLVIDLVSAWVDPRIRYS